MSGPLAGPAEGATAVPAVPQGIVVNVFARTDVGLLREHNEDDFLVADLTRQARTLMPDVQTHVLGPGGSLFVVCDGMGGAAAGEVASRTAVDTIYEKLTHEGPSGSWDELVGRLDRAIIEAGRRIYSMARADQERRGMGTTCTAAAMIDRRLFVAQVGDSRCYVLRNGVLQQVTRDQSLLTQLIEAGQVKPEDAASFEHSNIILQALGTTEMVNTDVTYHDLCRGDAIMLCSDGLSGMVCDAAIREVLVANPEPLAACRALTEAANRGGGEDNITVIVARFDGQELPEAPAEQGVLFSRFAKPRPAQFDRVPYTIPDQKFSDGGPAIPQAPEVPMGAVSVAGMSPDGADSTGAADPAMPGAWPAQPAGEAPCTRAAGPVETTFNGTGSDLAEALRGAAEAPRVIEWCDEDVPLDDLPAAAAVSDGGTAAPAAAETTTRASLRGWGLIAFLLLVLVTFLLVFESLRCSRTETRSAVPATADVLSEAAPPPAASVDAGRAAPTSPVLKARPRVLRPDPLAMRRYGGPGVPGTANASGIRPQVPGSRAPAPGPAPQAPRFGP
jgi:serine/threonine protein phosphatase PrpC